MATNIYPKPTTIPRWADTSTNVTEPSSGEKDVGWAVNAVHPSSYENWKSKSLGEWIKWINERWQDGATLDNIKLVAALEVDVAAVAVTNQAAVIGRGKGAGGEGGKFYGGTHATSGVGARGGYGEGGAAVTSGAGGSGFHGLGGAGAGATGDGGDGLSGQGGAAAGMGVPGRGVYGKGSGTAPGVQGDAAGIFTSVPTTGPGVHGNGSPALNGPGVSGRGGGTTGPGGKFEGATGTASGGEFFGGTPAPTGHGGMGFFSVGGAAGDAASDGGTGGYGRGAVGGGAGAGGCGLVGEAGSPANAGGKAAGVLGLGTGVTSASGIGSESVAAGVIGVAGDFSDPSKGYGLYGWGRNQNRGGVYGEGAGEGDGVRGSSLAGNGGYGVVAQGKAAAPKFGSFKMIGQNADPTTGENGAFEMTSSSHAEGEGHLKKSHGGAFRHVGVQAWAAGSSNGAGGGTLHKGLGVSSVSINGVRIRFNFLQAFSDTNYVTVVSYVGPATSWCLPQIITQATTYVEIVLYDIGGAAQIDLAVEVRRFHIHCCGW